MTSISTLTSVFVQEVVVCGWVGGFYRRDFRFVFRWRLLDENTHCDCGVVFLHGRGQRGLAGMEAREAYDELLRRG